MPASPRTPEAPAPGESGLASWEPADLAALVLPAWDDFIDLVGSVDLDAPSRVRGWTARAVCVHLGSWPGSRTLQQMTAEAERGDLDGEDPRSGTFDQQSHNEAVLAARSRAPRAEAVQALVTSRDEAAAYLAADAARELGRRRVRSVLGPLPLSTLVGAATFELAVHAMDLAPAGGRAPAPGLLSAGLASLVDTTGALAARQGLTANAVCATPEGTWAFAARPGSWSTVALTALPQGRAAVEGDAADLLDAAAGRRAVPSMLARRELRLHHVSGLLALTPIVEQVPGLPGGPALRATVRNLRGISRLVRRLPGVPG